MVAQERRRLEEAEAWYRKALEIYGRLGRPPLLVHTLAQIGVLRRHQRRLHEAVHCLGRALAIAAEYKMQVATQILVDLARVMKAMGEAEFTTAWRQAFEGQEPPLEALRDIMGELA